MLNIDGVIEGNHRCSLLGVDLNRQWINPDVSLHPTIYSTKQIISQILQANKNLLLFVDLHGHFGKKYIFMFGCNNDTNLDFRLQECVFPYLLSQRDENFSFDSCSFKVLVRVIELTNRFLLQKNLVAGLLLAKECKYCEATPWRLPFVAWTLVQTEVVI